MAKRKRMSRVRRGEPEAPTCNCISMCDDVLVSQGKGKHTLHGVIGAIVVRSLPSVLGGYVAYIRVSNLYGSQTVTVDFTFGEDTIFKFEATLDEPKSPLGVYTLVVPIRPFVAHHAGRYMFSAWSGQNVLAQTPIEIQVASPIENEP